MEKSCTGHVFTVTAVPYADVSLPVATSSPLNLSLIHFLSSLLTPCTVRVAVRGVLSESKQWLTKEANPQMFVRIIVPPTARVMYTYNSRCYPWEDKKAVIKARREAKRVLRRDSRSHKQREDESVTSLVQMGGVETIGMARDSRDATPITARNEAQAHYLNAIESKQLIFATGEAGCGKTWISAAKAAEA